MSFPNLDYLLPNTSDRLPICVAELKGLEGRLHTNWTFHNYFSHVSNILSRYLQVDQAWQN